MARWFNISGPCSPADHYMLPAQARLPDLELLLTQRAYFVLHAPRQVGKTTAMRALARSLTASGHYLAVHLSMETGAAFSSSPGDAEAAILADWRRSTANSLAPEHQPPAWPDASPGSRFAAALAAWAGAAPRPLVLLLDEIDALRDDALVSTLRQLRSGFVDRPQGFPSSIGLIGMRDVRDYVAASGGEGRLGSASPFNIKDRSFTLRNFTAAEVSELLGQHTAETGQVFLPEATARLADLSGGQPWLVNALAKELVEVIAPGASRSITLADVDRAREALIQRQDTHLDSLAERLREPRVRHVIEPMLAGTIPGDLPPDDVRYACDLGLVRLTSAGGLDVANPIYREVIVRTLAASPRAALPQIAPTWLDATGALVPSALLDAFLAFWRQHGEPLLRTTPYHEVAPHLVLMAFLHRVVNGGGRVEREYAIGTGRMDVLVTLGAVRLAMELKVWGDGASDPVTEGLRQLDAYLAGLSLDAGWLVVFDRRSHQPRLAERVSTEVVTSPGGRAITVVRA